MSVMPGAVWRPITIPGGNPGARTPGRAVILHVAASEAASLYGYFNNNPNANSHFYVAKDGTIEQYVDTAYQSWASLAANKNTISVETQGGVTSPDTEPWTAAQVAALGRICAWAHSSEGIPLTVMPDSKPLSRGIGWHRLGINPWRVTGGEVWSSSTGKVCPGTAKIAQVPAVIQAALQGADMPLTDADVAKILDWGVRTPDGSIRTLSQLIAAGPALLLDALVQKVDGDGKPITGAMSSLRAFLAWDDAKTLATRDAAAAGVAEIEGKLAAPVVDAKALADALVADTTAVSTLADALAAAIAHRLGNG